MAIWIWNSWFTIFGCVVTVLLIVALGILPLRLSGSTSASWIETICHAIGFLALFAGMIYVVPQYVRAFEEFEIELPPQTILLIVISNTVVRKFFIWVLLLPILLAADMAIFRALHKKDATRTLAKVWSGAITGLIVISILLSLWAVASPAAAMWNALQ